MGCLIRKTYKIRTCGPTTGHPFRKGRIKPLCQRFSTHGRIRTHVETRFERILALGFGDRCLIPLGHVCVCVCVFKIARALGFEPRPKVLETRMLPLHYARIINMSKNYINEHSSMFFDELKFTCISSFNSFLFVDLIVFIKIFS